MTKLVRSGIRVRVRVSKPTHRVNRVEYKYYEEATQHPLKQFTCLPIQINISRHYLS